MKFEKVSVSSLLLAGVLSLAVPAVAQQEVDPDRFEPRPAATQNQNAAVRHHKSALQARNAAPAHIATKAKSKAEPQQVSAVVKPEASGVQSDAGHR
jgi:hypothetical protein